MQSETLTPSTRSCPRVAALRSMLIVLLSAAPLGCERAAPPGTASRPPGESPSGRGFNVILVSVDTTRADALGCYGNAGVKTPNFDRMAAEGVRFEQCISSAPSTLPSHSTMLTGCYQFVHGARENGLFVVKPENVTLAEILKTAGYKTHAEVAATVLDHTYGLDQGFDGYGDMLNRVFVPESATDETAAATGSRRRSSRRIPPPLLMAGYCGFCSALSMPQDSPAATTKPHKKPRSYEDRKAEDVTEHALKWIRARGDEPFFLFLHYFDPHMPYEPPERFSAQYRDWYLAEIAYVDEQFGRILDELRSRKLAERTLVILTADHGEGRGQHGELTHSFFVYDSTQHVPLIFWSPARLPAGVVVPTQVRLVDLFASICDFAGLPTSPQNQGVSLLPLVADPQRDLQLSVYGDTFATQYTFGYSPLRFLRGNGWKYIHAPKPELYNVADDPMELLNVAAGQPQRVAAMREQLRTLIAESPPPPGGRASRRVVTSDQVEKLQALGYLSAGQSTEPETDEAAGGGELDQFEPVGVNPRDRVESMELLISGVGEMVSGEYKKAEQIYRRLLELEPNSSRAHKDLADTLVPQERIDEALAAYRRALEIDRKNAAAANSLANLLSIRGEFAEAEQLYLQALSSDPRMHLPRFGLANLLAQNQRFDEAIQQYEEAARLAPQLVEIQVKWGMALSSAGRADEAEARFREALRLDPGHAGATIALARLAYVRGRHREAVDLLAPLAETNKRDTALFRQLAVWYTELGDHKSACEYLRRAVGVDPDQPQPHLNLALSLAADGQTAEAIVSLRRALELDPRYLRAQLELARNLATARDEVLRRPAEAVGLAQSALQGMGEDSLAAWEVLALAQAAAGDLEAARAAAGRGLAIAQQAKDSAATERLGAMLKTWDPTGAPKP